MNRQVALSLILLLCFFITAPKQEEAYTPPSGSALAQKVHPRLLFVPEGYTGFGMKVSAMRTKLKTYHKTAFQTYIDTLDSHYSDSITAKDDILLKYDGMGYAFLALLDPSTMGPEFTFAHTKAEYAALAKSHALQIVSTLLSLGTGDGDVRHFSDGGGSASLAAAAIYDWTQSFWTMAEKQTLAQAFITMVSIPKGNLTKTLHTDAFEDSMQYYGSIAMFGDTIDGVDSTGTPFSTKLQAMLDEMASYWVEGTGYFPQLDFFYNGESGWHESVWGYGSTTFMTLSLLASGLSTAINKNYFYDSSYFRYYGKWLSAMTRPTYYPLTEPTGGYRTAKFNAMSQGGANEPVWAISASGLAGMLYGYDNTMSQAANWHVSKYGTGYTATDSEQREKWLMWKFYWGTGHLPAPPSTSPLALSLKQGIQAYSFRTGYGNVSDTFITFHAPNKMPKTGGHASALDHSSFTVEKYGNLIFHGGVPKSYSRGVPSYSGSANLDFSLLGIYKPGEVDDAGFNRMSQTWPSSTSSDPNPICKLSDTRCYIGTVTHEEINNGSYDYVAYDYSNMLPKSKATHTDREFLYLRGNADHEFIVVMDRAITADPSYQKRWHVKISFDPVAVGGLWTPISVDSTCPLVTGSSVISLTTDPRCTDGTWIPGGKWSTTADTVQITNNYPAGTSHGRMFLKSVYPASTLYKIGGDRHEFDDAEGKSFYFKTALDQTIANLNGDALERQYLIDHGADFAGRYRLEIRPNVARTADQFLTVMQIGDSKTLTKMDPVDQIATTTSNMIGANIKDPKLNKVVLFSSNTTGGNVSGSVTYTIKPTANSRHHLFNMPPSTSFKVDVTTSTTSQIVTVSPGTGYISSSQGVLVFGVSAAGVTIDLTPPAPPKNLR